MTKLLTAFALIAVLLFAGVPTAAAQNNPLVIPVSFGNAQGAFSGTFTPTQFKLVDGQLALTGTLAGTVTRAGKAIGSIVKIITLLVTGSSGTCQILHLELGPITLDLLGLVITTNQIVLDITAEAGPGNLLGNLLCAVANLLNTPNQTLVSLLNQILGLLT